MSEEPRQLRVGPGDGGAPVERFLLRRLPDATPDRVSKLLRQGRIEVDGKVADRGRVVAAGAAVKLLPRGRAAAPPLPNRKIRFEVLHEEPDLALVVKPVPLAMHPGPGHGTDTFLNALVARFPEMLELGSERGYGLVHRLDLETSGVLVVARTAAAYDGLVSAFSQRRVEKRYLVLVAGRAPERMTIEAPVDGKDARTEVERIEQAGPAALLSARPLTGRTHQIRIHLAGRGLPVLGDARYGRGRDEQTAQLYLPRLALHAERLAFEHPLSGARIEREVPLPRDLRRAWKRAQRLAAEPE